MGTRIRNEACPTCRKHGKDTRGDNLVVYSDGSAHCFSCHYHRFTKVYLPRKPIDGNENKAVLPSDFTREVPAKGWKWLLQYGLPYSYWKDYCGYSETQDRLMFLVGEPVWLSLGRYLGEENMRLSRRPGNDKAMLLPAKWRNWGDSHSKVLLLGGNHVGPVVLVEDIISAHKVAQVAACVPLFGTKISDQVLKTLKALKRPVVLWLDEDQYTLLAPKLNRLQTFLDVPVRYIHTEKDPKGYSTGKLKEFLC